jgi:hypothetical protein
MLSDFLNFKLFSLNSVKKFRWCLDPLLKTVISDFYAEYIFQILISRAEVRIHIFLDYDFSV